LGAQKVFSSVDKLEIEPL